jgi:hypothetical protein
MARYMDNYFTDLDAYVPVSAALPAYPFTVNFWTKVHPDVIGTILSLHNTTNNHAFRFNIFLVSYPTTRLRFTAVAATNAVSTTANDLVVDGWNMCTAVCDSATSRTVHLNAGTGATSTVNLTPTTPTRIMIGGSANTGVPAPNFTGDMAELAIWSASLNAEERDSLYKGAKASSIRPQNLTLYMPMVRDVTDLKGLATSIDVRTTSPSDHLRRYG